MCELTAMPPSLLAGVWLQPVTQRIFLRSCCCMDSIAHVHRTMSAV